MRLAPPTAAPPAPRPATARPDSSPPTQQRVRDRLGGPRWRRGAHAGVAPFRGDQRPASPAECPCCVKRTRGLFATGSQRSQGLAWRADGGVTTEWGRWARRGCNGRLGPLATAPSLRAHDSAIFGGRGRTDSTVPNRGAVRLAVNRRRAPRLAAAGAPAAMHWWGERLPFCYRAGSPARSACARRRASALAVRALYIERWSHRWPIQFQFHSSTPQHIMPRHYKTGLHTRAQAWGLACNQAGGAIKRPLGAGGFASVSLAGQC